MNTTKTGNIEQQVKDKEFAQAMLSSNRVEAQNGFNQIYKRYKAPIFFLVLRMVKMNRELADDLVQEIFVKVFEKIKNYDSSNALSTWMYTIANNHVIDYKRRQNVEVLSIETLRSAFGDGDEDVSEAAFQLEDKSANTFKSFVGKERATIVLEALNKGLKCEQSKQIIALIFLDDMSYEKVAQQMELPLGTIKNMMFRAKKEMRKYISEVNPEFDFGKVIPKTHEWKSAKQVFA